MSSSCHARVALDSVTLWGDNTDLCTWLQRRPVGSLRAVRSRGGSFRARHLANHGLLLAEMSPFDGDSGTARRTSHEPAIGRAADRRPRFTRILRTRVQALPVAHRRVSGENARGLRARIALDADRRRSRLVFSAFAPEVTQSEACKLVAATLQQRPSGCALATAT